MEITIRTATPADYPQLLSLFQEFAAFEQLPEKMTNSLDQMLLEKEFFNCLVAETTIGK